MSKISNLANMSGINTKDDDLFVIVSIDQGEFGTKGITRKELAIALRQQQDETYFITSNAETLSESNGYIQEHTLSENSLYIDGLKSGGHIRLVIKPSEFTISWPTISWVDSGNEPTLSDTNHTVVDLWKSGDTLFGVLVGNSA